MRHICPWVLTGRCHGSFWLPILPCWLLLLLLVSAANAAVISSQVDSEVAELHAAMEEGFERIGKLTSELQKAGAIPASVGSPGALNSQQQAPAAQESKSTVDPSKIASIRKLESDFATLQ